MNYAHASLVININFAMEKLSNSSEEKIYTVGEISFSIKSLIEGSYGYISIRGEISGLMKAASGHVYFNLKDSNSLIACTCWKGVAAKINTPMEDGMEVIVRGKLTAYAANSRYQFNVSSVAPSGVGSLMKLLQERKQEMIKKGIFADERKKPIPKYPKLIAVITSESGAVLHDIKHRVQERFPMDMLLFPVAVQGNNAAGEVANAIRYFNKIERKPDVIIVARGGGSIEDLWAFNEEEVVMAAYASSIAIISAIGHETDFTLLDFVADLRAPTPTAAAEMATPLKDEIMNSLDSSEKLLISYLKRYVIEKRNIYKASSAALVQVKAYLMQLQQRIDFIPLSPAMMIEKKRAMLSAVHIQKATMVDKIQQKSEKLKHIYSNIFRSINICLANKNSRFNIALEKLSSGDITKTLQRGFSIVRIGNKVITQSADAKLGDRVKIQLYDSSLDAQIYEAS